MEFRLVITLSVLVFCAVAEKCSHINDCSLTQCEQSSVHSHIACDKGFCTCKEDGNPCITTPDCPANARCFGSSGHLEHFHCLDGTCQCI